MGRYTDGEYRRSHRYCYVGLGMVCALLGLIAICVSFTTDHWLHYDVDRDTVRTADPAPYGYTQAQFNKLMTEDSKFFSRQRGMLRTCYCDNTTWSFKEADKDDVDENCLREIAYDFDDIKTSNLTTYEDDVFDLGRNLMRCHLAFFILGIAVLAIAIISATVGCWCRMMTAFIVASVCCCIGALGLLLGMVFFHWYKYLEENEVDFDYYGRKAWHQEPVLDENTRVRYHYSYGLGWVAFIFTFLAFIFFALAAWSTNRKKEQESRGLVKSSPAPQTVVAPQPMMVPAQQNNTSDDTVYVINHYATNEKMMPPPAQPQYVSQPQVIQQEPLYPTKPMYTSHTVYQSAVPRGHTGY